MCTPGLLHFKNKGSSAFGWHKLITNSIQQKGLDIKNCRGQRYDGDAVMSGKYSGLHKKIQDVAPYAYHEHCAQHNLNLMLKDAIESVTETRPFHDTIESAYNFFGYSIVGWQKLQNVHDCSCSNLTLKALNLIRWSGQCDAVYALKERFCDVLKCLPHIILTSTKPKERGEAVAIKKQIENFDFVYMLVVQSKILQLFVCLFVVTPPFPQDGGTARTAIQVYAVNLIKIRLGERWQPISNQF